MGLSVVLTRAGEGIDAPQVKVEVHLANGLPAFHLVGMAQTSVKEARDRVRSALINSGFEFPARRITVNLAPATIPKQGGRYDLPIAIGVLVAAGVIPAQSVINTEFIGELGLNGEIKAVRGILPVLLSATSAGHTLFHPTENEQEAALVDDAERFAAPSLLTVFQHLIGQQKLPQGMANSPDTCCQKSPRWDDIIGQGQAKRALVIAAAGSHNILFVGPPGTGKSLLASRLLSLMPPLRTAEALEVASIHSVKGESVSANSLHQRPFRSPHHTSSAIALTGGGATPQPGEVSLAHHGVLFLDEFPEFGRKALDVLREPLETGDIHISRASGQARYPAKFQLIAAMNPSPTGDIADGRCSPDKILRYLNSVSGPLLDRIDLQVDVPRLPDYFLQQTPEATAQDSAVEAYMQIQQARQQQLARQNCLNAHVAVGQLAAICQLAEADMQFLQHASSRLKLSMRTFHRTLKVARTIADLEQAEHVTRAHLAEALGYRALDKIINQFSSN
ncbi:YifB family Mg chelatase-like AAA ATPase [Alteromonas pelagimontana]|uniref:YifB family Mg chelatase-like AAA ATPase n=1 Tax=Alteromonas pelagimontana TaxID=1858656 RepID=A0A6M4MFE4_9ALTE|nr:YifB family Mg chelatase-like AAA ATPase [Alteromonas pelagimontana]QJR80886.1 YifB family Mg chelatase-like AAA ATPase [Alteromonas pelagimontana]